MLRIMMSLVLLAMMRCLPYHVAKPCSIREAASLRSAQHRLPQANIMQKNLICPLDKSGFLMVETGGLEPSTSCV